MVSAQYHPDIESLQEVHTLGLTSYEASRIR